MVLALYVYLSALKNNSIEVPLEVVAQNNRQYICMCLCIKHNLVRPSDNVREDARF